jgi:hypothetical protein
MQNLSGIDAVPVVNGSVIIAGQSYDYSGGVLDFQGQKYIVSDAHDFIITPAGKAVGAIVKGVLTPLSDLTQAQRQFIRNKYKV